MPPHYLIVHTSWYKEDIAKMIEIARKQLSEDTSLLSVPGSLELAAGAKRYIEDPDVRGLLQSYFVEL